MGLGQGGSRLPGPVLWVVVGQPARGKGRGLKLPEHMVFVSEFVGVFYWWLCFTRYVYFDLLVESG